MICLVILLAIDSNVGLHWKSYRLLPRRYQLWCWYFFCNQKE